MYKIVKAPREVLSTKAKEIKIVDSNIKQLISDMAETLANAKDPEGIGLAAPQVGKGIQLFIIKESENAPLRVFINPEILSAENKQKKPKKKTKKNDGVRLEGCLSLDNVWGAVDRFDKLRLKFTDENGKRHEEDFSGFYATIIQHEFDHLQGILFPARVLEQKGILYKSKKDDKNETIFEEIPL